ncbi:SDR family oxidoreductase [Actinocorallia populi]|uniref:SDR family oxidoreductase n=1 Tax=Actinocorallia populi TaxID=2079200 RepID=UPI000D087460|nr:SDR family oxidoreductase [Actinocorallia populi]
MSNNDLSSLAGARVLVVGASAGIGRAFSVGAVKAGARVVLAARRAEQLESLREEAGGGEAVAADLTREEDCARLVEAVRDRLGGLDLIVSCIGAAPMRLIADTGDDDWRRLFETNVLSVGRLLRGCLPLLEHDAMVVALSSESVGQPRPGIGAYSTSKAALERMIESWRIEHPRMRFTTVTVGASFPTDFGVDFEAAILDRMLRDWISRGLAQEEMMDPQDVADVLLGVVASALGRPGVCLEHLTLRSPTAVVDASGRPLLPSRKES